jgi:hypothetical protein
MNDQLDNILKKCEFFAKEYAFKLLIINLFGKLRIYNVVQFNARTDVNMNSRDFLEFSANDITEFMQNVTIPLDNTNGVLNTDFNKKIEKNFINVESYLYKVNQHVEYLYLSVK